MVGNNEKVNYETLKSMKSFANLIHIPLDNHLLQELTKLFEEAQSSKEKMDAYIKKKMTYRENIVK